MDQLTFECHKLNSGGCRIVDGGRPGMLAQGVARSGAADLGSLHHLNELLDQGPDNPALEFTLDAGHWLISGQGQIAFGGADMSWRLNGRPAELYTTIDLDGDYLLQGGTAQKGLRSYLAVRGKWEGLPSVWHSFSPGAPGISNCEVGMVFFCTSAGRAPYSSDLEVDQHLPELPLNLAVMPGPEWSWLNDKQQNQLLNNIWRVAPTSNRQGLRLQPSEELNSQASAISRKPSWQPSGYFPGDSGKHNSHGQQQLISSPVLPGTVQYPASGEPILLLRDAHTVGGYPRVLVLKHENDLNLLGQLRPGEGLSFG